MFTCLPQWTQSNSKTSWRKEKRAVDSTESENCFEDVYYRYYRCVRVWRPTSVQIKNSCILASIKKSARCVFIQPPLHPLHLHRLLTVYPQSKIYFSHWSDLSFGSAPVAAHGKKVMGGVALAVSKIDDLSKGLLDLSEQHAFTMRVDPANFKVSEYPDTVYVPILLRVTDTDDACFYPRVEFVLRTKYVITICYRLLCSCCPTAFSWLSPPCSPRSSPQRPTAPLINSCAPCPWLSLRNTVELPRGVARDHVALGAKWNNKLHTAQTCDYRVLYVSNSVLICDSICISPITLYGRVLLPHRALMTERNRHCFMAPRNWDGRHREPAVVTHTILFMDGFNCNTQASLDRQQTFSCGSHPVNLVV